MQVTASLPVNIALALLAVVLLVVSAEIVVNRLIKIARHLAISPLFVGLTFSSIGTSIPEITTHVVGSIEILRGNLDMFITSGVVLGTNIGSDIVQQTLIIGIVALFGTIHVSKKFMLRDFLLMILTAVVLWVFTLNGYISRLEGFILLGGYCYYVYRLWKDEDYERQQENKKAKKLDWGFWKDVIIAIVFMGLLIGSADFILSETELFVHSFNIGSSLLGILVIGIATALPELTTSITAVLKKSSQISIGTLIGSNITNPAFGIGIGALISGYQVPKPIIFFDLPVKIVTAIIIGVIVWKSRKFDKKTSIILIAMYLAYILLRLTYFSADI